MLWMEKNVEASGQPQIVFLSKAPHTTLWLMIAYHEDRDKNWIKTFLRSMMLIGWSEDTTFPKAPPTPNGKIRTVEIQKDGADRFMGWTKKERHAFMKEAEAVLIGYGKGVHHMKLSMTDCM